MKNKNTQTLWDRTRWLRWTLGFIIAILAILISVYNKNADNTTHSPKSPGSIITTDQTGDNMIINNNIEIPEPNITLTPISINQAHNDNFQSEFMLTIDTKVAINSLLLKALAPNIVKMDVVPQKNGAAMFGHTGIREDHAFTTIQQSQGNYKITIIATEQGDIKFEYDY